MKQRSNRDRWANWYAGLTEPAPYGDSASYRILAEHVADCATVEDWGCGKGWMRNFIPDDRYRGVDGTHTMFADEVADLCRYRSDVDGIVMRHVIEHEWEWNLVLANAMASFRRRFALALFTPLQDETRQIDHTMIVEVPDIGFAEADIVAHFNGLPYERIVLDPSPTKYGIEHIYLVEKPS